jgi:predicted restriction endonuclease
MSDRENIPMAVRRAVLVEAGYRCAIPTCPHPTTEFAHIVPHAQTQDDSFENLIALCPNSHTRYDIGDRADRTAMRIFKAEPA